MAANEDDGKAGSPSAANCNAAPNVGNDDKNAAATPAPPKVESPTIVPTQFDAAGLLGPQMWAAKVELPPVSPASSAIAWGEAPAQPRKGFSAMRNGLHQLRLHLAPLATIAALAAGVGAGGALATLCFERVVERPTVETAADTAALAEAVARINADVAALKASIDQSAKSAGAQMAKLAERFDRSERALAEPNAKLAKLTESMERLDRRVASATPAAPVEITGAIPEPPLPQPAPLRDLGKGPIVSGWTLRNVYDGAALIEGRGRLVEVEPGDPLPGIGRVQAIRRQDGRWVVVTSKGLIVPR